MKFFFTVWGTTVAVLLLGFVGWIVTRIQMAGTAPGSGWETANFWIARAIVWDLYALGVVMAYVAFVGAWHLWERLSGRMELDHLAEQRKVGSADEKPAP